MELGQYWTTSGSKYWPLEILVIHVACIIVNHLS